MIATIAAAVEATPPTRNRRSHVSAVGMNIWAMQHPTPATAGSTGVSGISSGTEHRHLAFSGRGTHAVAAMPEAERPIDYEPSDASSRLIAALAVGLAAALIAIPLALAAIYPSALRIAAPGPTVRPPPPRLEVAPREDFIVLRRAEDARLSRCARDPSGAVRIPIDRAIELTAERGLPGWPKP